MDEYEQKWYRQLAPGLLIILIDQSSSMQQSTSSAEFTHSDIGVRLTNQIIDLVIQRAFNGTHPKDLAYIYIIGYSDSADIMRQGWLQDLYSNPKRIERRKMLLPDGVGGMVNVDVEIPIWVDKDTNGGDANMKEAFDAAYELTKSWIKDHKNSPAPIVLNISDGNPYWGIFSKEECIQKTVEAVEALRKLKTSDGNALVYNVFLDETFKTSFPLYEDEIESENGKFLYGISSIVPLSYIGNACKYNMKIRFGARACLTNTDASTMIIQNIY